MNFNENDLLKAKEAGIISCENYDNLIQYLKSDNQNEELTKTEKSRPKITMESFLYYLGAVIIIMTMVYYLRDISEKYGNNLLCLLSFVYFCIFTFIGNCFWKKNKKTPAGLLYVCAASITPVFVRAFEGIIGLSNMRVYDFRIDIITVEIITAIVSFIFLKYRRFGLLVLVSCFSLWRLAFDTIPRFIQNVFNITSGVRETVDILFAVLVIALAYILDKKEKNDYSLWLYIFGPALLWFAASDAIMIYNHGLNLDKGYAYFGLFGFLYMVLSVFFQRKIFMALGVLAVLCSLWHFTYHVLKNPVLFSVIVVIFGLALIFYANFYAKFYETVKDKIGQYLSKKNR